LSPLENELSNFNVLVASLAIPHFGGAWKPENDPLLASDKFDAFKNLDTSSIHRLQHDPKTFFILNYVMEGGSYKFYNFYQLLTLSAIRHNIPCSKIFLITSNLLEEESYDAWQQLNFPNDRINVISFNYWDRPFLNETTNWSIDHTANFIRNKKQFNFLCLNRRKRSFRLAAIYKIIRSSIRNSTMLSHDKITETELTNLHSWFTRENNRSVSLDDLIKVAELPPSVLDYSDFEVNWAMTMPDKLFQNSLISTVGETLYDSHDNTSIFYSEKSFKPMMYNHPVFIFGQPRINTYFQKLGFRTYSNYFNLDFDLIENHVDRLSSQIEQLEQLNDRLNSMNTEQRVDWYLQDRETLEHNKQVIKDQHFNTSKFKKLVNTIKSLSS
jgi:hypothetical protein